MSATAPASPTAPHRRVDLDQPPHQTREATPRVQIPPPDSAAAEEGSDGTAERVGGPAWWRDLDPVTRRWVRRAATLMALLPMTVVLAVKAPELGRAPLLGLYGMGVLLTTLSLIYLAFVRYDDPSEDAPTVIDLDAPRPSVSMLVAAFNEEDGIERCVRSLVESDEPGLEVIVIDDCSTDDTAEVLRRLQQDIDFTFIALEENVGKKRALVAGLEQANGDMLAFTDSDCVMAPDAVRRCVDALERHPEIGGVGGHARAANADENLLTRIQDVWYDGQFNVSKAAEASIGSVTCLSGPLAVFRREAIFNYFPAWANDRFAGKEFLFATDRQLTGYLLGQEWVGRKLKDDHADSSFVKDADHPEQRWDVGYVRSALVWTDVPDSLRTFIKQQVRWKKSFIRNLFFTGKFHWRRGVPETLLFYLHALFVFLAPIMAVRHLVLQPVQGEWALTFLYLAGVSLKGSLWALAFKAHNRHSWRWVYRPAMSLMSALLLSWLLPYSALTLRRAIWSRG